MRQQPGEDLRGRAAIRTLLPLSGRRIFRHTSPTFAAVLFIVMVAAAGLVPARADAAGPGPAAGAPAPPQLIVESPPGLAAQAEKIRRFDTSRLDAILRLVGTGGTQRPVPAMTAPIRVILAARDSDLARSAPEWATGYAVSDRSVVVLIPSRSFSYPHDSLEEVLQHEVAHVLIHRAAGGRPVPRWFNEGLAMAASRPWDLEDRTRVVLEMLPGGRVPFREVDALFDEGSGQAHRAYTLSGAFVRFLLQDQGEELPGRILARLAAGEDFERAFQGASGTSLDQAEAAFYRRQNIWSRWVPILSSAGTLWAGITLLALVAIRMRRRKDARIAARWDEEEGGPGPPVTNGHPGVAPDGENGAGYGGVMDEENP